MASTTLNGSFSGSNAPNYAIKIDLTSTSNGSAANTSNVTAKLYMRRTASVAYPQYSLDYSSTVRIVINGSDSGTGKINFDTRSTTDWILLKTYTVNNIAHNADGTKTISVQGYFEPNATSSLYGGTVSGNFVLDTIPRASSVTVTDANIGDYPTITISRASSSFNHTISWGTGATKPTTTTAILSHTTATKITTWDIPASVYALCPNAKSYKYIWIRCDTFSSSSASSYIGTTWAKCTAYVDEATNKPNLSVAWANTDLSSLTGDAEKLVRYKSSVTATATYSANNSATIRAISLSCTDGQTQSSSPATFTSVGGNSFTVSVTDSRGFTTTKTKVYPIVDYITPSVNAVATRPQPTTGEVRLEISGLYFNGTFGAQTNTATLQYRYKSTAAWSEWVTVTPTLTGNSYSYNGVLAETYDYQTPFDFAVRLTDKLNAIVNTASVSRGIPVFDWGENDFNLNVPLKYQNADFVIDNLTSTDTAKALSANQGRVLKDSIPVLPTTVKNRYLHTNASNGNLEWAAIGTYSQTTPSNVNISPATRTTIATLTLPAGTYIVSGFHAWTAGFSDNTIDYISVNGSSYMYNRAKGENGGGSVVTAAMSISAQSTITLQTYLYGSTARTASSIKLVAVKVV